MPHVLIAQTLPPSPPVITVPPAAKGPADPLSTTPEDLKAFGSLYLRCDGRPNNVTDGESFARFLGAVTLLSLFAPSPEMPDSSERLFGEKGVAVCNELLDNPKQETNGLRRIPLILGRAIHQIEAKNYDTAIADVAKARQEATAIGLVGNPYFDRSMGLSFNIIEAHALLRSGHPAEAQHKALENALRLPFSFYAGLASPTFPEFNRELTSDEEAFYRANGRISRLQGIRFANRLEEAGRFAEAAKWRDSITTVLNAMDTASKDTWTYSVAAISYALAGNWQLADQRAAEAQANMDARIAAGKPETTQAADIERLDLYQVLKQAHEGHLTEARRSFAARSKWIAPSFGAIVATNALLRQGARPDELFGSLAKTPDALWAERRTAALSVMLENDKNNRTLWTFLLPYAKISDYEAASKTVWRVQKSWILAKEPMKDSRFYLETINSGPLTQPEALLLHGALQAKAKGFAGLVILTLPERPSVAYVEFGNPGDADMTADGYLDADTVIAALRPVFPSPEDLAARRKS
ncbi:hypothetical protein GCM10011614_17800 [Novosphingobium colocasiae]|uniref:Uncharacterized protein n=2 Tax=Novosphingobium colocasiae TaxID=1256513 RepID=A0A918PFM3_9SPHN|nr:hypothetical protein GCM10011614_17800 [Novosphingobium colocasiae]